MEAAVPTELATATTGAMTDLGTFLTGTVALAVMGLVVIGIGITFAVKWTKRGAKGA